MGRGWSSFHAMKPSTERIELLLDAWSAGDDGARDTLVELVYPHLKRMASGKLRGETVGHTLDTTALVHEACLDLLSSDRPEWRGRAQFFAFLSTVMRRVLVDHARRRGATKRGGDWGRVELGDHLVGSDPDFGTILDLERALARLAANAPRMAQVAECRIFGGMNDAQVAEALEVSERTAAREWQKGRAWLRVALEED
jgi:RNA polymerase sigma factor (TIGR02999 family)